MNNKELIYTALIELSRELRTHPKRITYEDTDFSKKNVVVGPTITWQSSEDKDNTKTIIIGYNPLSNIITTHVYTSHGGINYPYTKPNASVFLQLNKPLWLSKTYRKFLFLKKKLIFLKKEQEGVDFLQKLGTIFPSLFEDSILK